MHICKKENNAPRISIEEKFFYMKNINKICKKQKKTKSLQILCNISQRNIRKCTNEHDVKKLHKQYYGYKGKEINS